MAHAWRISLACAFTLSTAQAQVRSGPVHHDTGPVSELSTNVRTGSRPVHERGRSVRDGSGGRLSGNPVRGSVTGDVRSGPVSEVSVGSVRAARRVGGSGTPADAPAGILDPDGDGLPGEVIAQPVDDLGPLQEQLRALQPIQDDAAAAGEDDEDPEAAGADAPGPAENRALDGKPAVP